MAHSRTIVTQFLTFDDNRLELRMELPLTVEAVPIAGRFSVPAMYFFLFLTAGYGTHLRSLFQLRVLHFGFGHIAGGWACLGVHTYRHFLQVNFGNTIFNWYIPFILS